MIGFRYFGNKAIKKNLSKITNIKRTIFFTYSPMKIPKIVPIRAIQNVLTLFPFLLCPRL